MQEYLNTETYEYKLAHKKPDGDWVSIPDGANYAYKNDEGICFLKNALGFNLLAWQRPQQPEALPFIDDEPRKNSFMTTGQHIRFAERAEKAVESLIKLSKSLSIQDPKSLNDQYSEIEQVRQAVKVKSGSDSDHAADAMSYGFMGGIDATLAERQSTYGSFEDVAFVTENIMSVLGHVRVNGLSELPNTHRMALYMIASKMARIVNGDFNHIDGWHDIGGYAKLVEDLIKENNKTIENNI